VSHELFGTACSSAEECISVGGAQGSGTAALAEGWNGKEWKIEETPSPTEAKFSRLFSVSCATSEACTATGDWSNAKNEFHTLAERWNGKEWSVQETPNPPEVLATDSLDLSGVSCPSTKECVAVGSYIKKAGSREKLIERWNGKTWAIEEVANPPEASELDLISVSCSTTEACTAVGYTGEEKLYAERWNGKEWTLESIPMPVERHVTNGELLSSVSCPSVEACTAVGHYTNSSYVEVPLVEHWNGKVWATQTAPSPPEAERSIPARGLL
jgi:hypothetical protein